MANTKSTVLLVLQLFIGITIIAWLSYDFYFTLIEGVTYKIRLNDTLDIRVHPFVFIITVSIKLFIYSFFIWLVRDCYRKLRK